MQEFQIDKGGVELTELVELYQSAVEYDSIGDLKNAAIYKEKMVFLFLKPHVSRLFQPAKRSSPKTMQTKRSKSPPKVRTEKKSPRANSPKKVETNQ